MPPESGQVFPDTASAGDLKIQCPNCGEMRGSRAKRRGFVQKQIMPFFGYFPWSCGSCRFTWNSKVRGEKRKRRSRSKAFPNATFTIKPESTNPATPNPPITPTFPHSDDDTHEDIGD